MNGCWRGGVVCLAIMAAAGSVRGADLVAANKLAREAQSLFFNGKLEAADAKLSEAEASAEQAIQEGLTADDPKLKSLQSKLAKLRQDVDRKLGAGKLDVGLKLRNAREALASSEKALAQGQNEETRRLLDFAQRNFENFEKQYAGQYADDDPEVMAFRTRLVAGTERLAASEAQGKAQADEARAAAAATAAASQVWIDRLRPFLAFPGQEGYDKNACFTGSYTADAAEMSRQGEIMARLQAELAAYRSNGPVEASIDSLKEDVRQAEDRLRTFAESCMGMGKTMLNEAERELGRIDQWMAAETAKLGSGTLPNIMSKDVLENVRAKLDEAARLLGDGEARVKKARAEFAGLIEQDMRLRKARIGETRMQPDQFGGGEAKNLKAKAESIVKAAKPDAKVLRTTVISPDWREESVVEWTDTTQTALRHRVTRQATAQVAAKAGGETRIYTVHLAEDRGAGGSWGQLYGHVMFEDPIFEQNVDQ